ncbi:MAG: FAD:protein FMN transferase [Rhodothermales bacterium]|nr:FAD:protein FMN transferase [Rhodothermales bacterium]
MVFSYPPFQAIRRAMRCQLPAFMAVSIIGLQISCGAPPASPAEPYEYRQLHLGVQVRIVLYARKEADARGAARAAYDRMAMLEDVFSDYRAHSEIRRLSETAHERPAPVSPELFRVLAAATDLARRTDGAFDVTAGPFVALWRDARRSGALPDSTDLALARARVGWTAVQLDAAELTVRLALAGMAIDLGGIAKGYILDEAMVELTRRGIHSALIEAGGDLLVSGAPPGRAGWQIAIPNAPPDLAAAASALTFAAVATSGDTKQYMDVDGVRYSHVLDPRTGMALTSRALATVIAPDGMTADSYATALTVLTKDEGLALLAERPDLRAFVRSTADQAPVR